jgi:hypothetical protein
VSLQASFCVADWVVSKSLVAHVERCRDHHSCH